MGATPIMDLGSPMVEFSVAAILDWIKAKPETAGALHQGPKTDQEAGGETASPNDPHLQVTAADVIAVQEAEEVFVVAPVYV